MLILQVKVQWMNEWMGLGGWVDLIMCETWGNEYLAATVENWSVRAISSIGLYQHYSPTSP